MNFVTNIRSKHSPAACSDFSLTVIEPVSITCQHFGHEYVQLHPLQYE